MIIFFVFELHEIFENQNDIGGQKDNINPNVKKKNNNIENDQNNINDNKINDDNIENENNHINDV